MPTKSDTMSQAKLELEIPPPATDLWLRWRGYLARWLAFGLVVSVFQPVADPEGVYWTQKLYQSLWGLSFGLVCGLVFTPLENKLNAQGIRWKTWSLVIATWLVVKVVFVSTLALL